MHGVSLPVVRRLPRYYRFLSGLKNNGIVRISSKELAQQMDLTASQIRQDINCFGGFGQQGYGYNVNQLAAEIEKILFLDNRLPAILIGVGNLGRALTSFLYDAKGIDLVGLFDKNPRAVLEQSPDLNVMPVSMLDRFCEEHHPVLGILCIPSESAQGMAEKLVSLGIRGLWNFSDTDLRIDRSVSVENVHLGDSIMTLGFAVNTKLLGDGADG